MSDEKVLTKEIAEQFMIFGGSVNDDEFTAIEDEAAEILSEGEGLLALYGLTRLSDTVALCLSERSGLLILSGLKKLSDAAAESLSKHEGGLVLDGLTKLSDAAAESLSNYGLNSAWITRTVDDWHYLTWRDQELLSLDGLTELSDAAAESLSNHHGDLDLDGLKSLSDVAAESLSNHRGGLSLDNVTELSAAAADHLASHPLADPLENRSQNNIGKLVVSPSGFSELTRKAFEAGQPRLRDWVLTWFMEKTDGGRFDGWSHEWLDLGTYKAIDDDLLGGLIRVYEVAGFEAIYLNGLTSLSDAAAESLSTFEGGLDLGGLTSLSDAAAESLGKHEGDLVLDLDGLPESAAQILRDAGHV